MDFDASTFFLTPLRALNKKLVCGFLFYEEKKMFFLLSFFLAILEEKNTHHILTRSYPLQEIAPAMRDFSKIGQKRSKNFFCRRKKFRKKVFLENFLQILNFF